MYADPHRSHGVHHSSSRHICTLFRCFSFFPSNIKPNGSSSVYILFCMSLSPTRLLPVTVLKARTGFLRGRTPTNRSSLSQSPWRWDWVRNNGPGTLTTPAERRRLLPTVRIWAFHQHQSSTLYTGYKTASVLENLRAVTVDAMINILT